MVGGSSGKAAGFYVQVTVASAMGGTRIVGPTHRDQAYVPRGEPTFRKGAGLRGVVRSVLTRVLVLGVLSCRKFLVAVVLMLWVGVEGLGRFLLVPLLLKGDRLFLLCGRWLSFWNRKLVHKLRGWWRGCCLLNLFLQLLPPPRMLKLLQAG